MQNALYEEKTWGRMILPRKKVIYRCWLSSLYNHRREKEPKISKQSEIMCFWNVIVLLFRITRIRFALEWTSMKLLLNFLQIYLTFSKINKYYFGLKMTTNQFWLSEALIAQISNLKSDPNKNGAINSSCGHFCLHWCSSIHIAHNRTSFMFLLVIKKRHYSVRSHSYNMVICVSNFLNKKRDRTLNSSNLFTH